MLNLIHRQHAASPALESTHWPQPTSKAANHSVSCANIIACFRIIPTHCSHHFTHLKLPAVKTA